MKKQVLTIRFEIISDSDKSKPTNVEPYTRIRNGKKEYVKGYIRKK